MCACRVEAGSGPSTPIDIEEYYLNDMEGRSEIMEDDVYAQLAQKEKDLNLAAELGKMLLDKNEQLGRNTEIITDEYNAKLEELEQQKYHLRLRLETIEGQYDNTVKELQSDVIQLRVTVHDQNQHFVVEDREKGHMIRELAQQNERLNEQIRKAAQTEEQLNTQVGSLKETISSRRISMHGHIHQLEVMREEINLLSERKLDLECRIATITEERDTMAQSVEESQDRIMMLERMKREQEQLIHSQENAILELQDANSQLHTQMENVSQQSSHSSLDQSQTLFSELSQMNESGDMMDNQSQSELFGNYHNSVMMADMMEEDDIECDDEDFALAAIANSTMGSESQFLMNYAGHEEAMELRKEVIEVYRQLKKLCRELRQPSKHNDSGGDEELFTENVQRGSLMAVLDELKILLQELTPEKRKKNEEEIKEKIEMLQSELSLTQYQVMHLTTEIESRDMELKAKMEDITNLTNKLTMQQNDLQSLQAERDHLQDQAIGQLSRDDVIEQARRDRNEAVDKRNKMELDLTRSKLDLMSLNSQLMEAIQQKVAISQQLDQWQVDMENLIEIQMQKRIQEESDKDTVQEALNKQMKKSSSSGVLFMRH